MGGGGEVWVASGKWEVLVVTFLHFIKKRGKKQEARHQGGAPKAAGPRGFVMRVWGADYQGDFQSRRAGEGPEAIEG